MSDLLNDASLVLIPSGIKASKVYSQIPEDGSGDMTFSRASTGTRINSQGFVEVVPYNLLEQSETFDSSTWVKNNLSVSANSTTAPNGTNTAESLTTTITGQCNCIQNMGFAVGEYTLSVYIKKVDLNFSYVEFGYAYCWVNLTTGAITGGSQYSSGWTFVSATATDVGNGWFRVEMVAYCSIAGTYGVRPLQPVSTSGDYSSGATNKVTYLWGAQVVQGTTAKTYYATTDRLNIPRLNYQNGGGGCPSLLLEKQSTNLALYSEQFDNAAWTKYESTITANATTSPDGTQNADLLLDNSSTDAHSAYQVITASAGTLTWSVYAKAQNNNFLIISAYTGSHNRTWFNLSTGAVGTNASGNTATIENMGNGWYRCIVSRAYVSGTLVHEVGISKTDGVFSYTGNGADGVYIYGAQLEASSYPTSYINTTSASATRVADLASVSQGTIANFGTGAFSVFFDINYAKLGDAGQLALLGNRQSSNWWRVRGDGTNIDLELNGSNGYALNQILNTPEITSRTKIAFTRNGNSLICYVNGVQKFSTNNIANSSDFTTGNSYVEFNAWDNGTYHIACTEYNEAVLFKTALTATELASLTTI